MACLDLGWPGLAWACLCQPIEAREQPLAGVQAAVLRRPHQQIRPRGALGKRLEDIALAIGDHR